MPPGLPLRPVSARARRWLQVPGSLTQHLQRASGAVRVQVLQQGHSPLWPEEQRALGQPRYQRAHGAHVRTVLLWCGTGAAATPAVLARSAVLTPQSRLRWRGLRGLGNQPLAQLLYDTPHIRRSPLRCQRHAAPGPAGRHVLRQWQHHAGTPDGHHVPRRNVWSRSSVFAHAGARIIVTEWFAPHTLGWPLAPAPTHGSCHP